MNGKIKIEKMNSQQLEGIFYWPSNSQCTENDHHLIMDLFLVWRFLNDTRTSYPETAQVVQTVANNLDDVIEKWLKIPNFCTDDRICHYTRILLQEILSKIWNSGLNIDTIRKYYQVITKSSRNIEETDGLGFMKLIYSQMSVLPTTQEIDGIIRKRPIHYYAVHIHVLSRKLATVSMIKDFLEIKSQVEDKERVNFLVFCFYL